MFFAKCDANPTYPSGCKAFSRAFSLSLSGSESMNAASDCASIARPRVKSFSRS
jgi:hypothetical protein